MIRSRKPMDAAEHNRRAWDQLARQGSRFAPAGHAGGLPGSLPGDQPLRLAAGKP